MKSVCRKPRCGLLVTLSGCFCRQKAIITFRRVVEDGEIFRLRQILILFPSDYNFRYNIYSSEWPVANRAIELYLQKKSENEGWERQINGLSNNEKANLLLEKHTFKELLADVEQRNLQNNIVGLEASRLFARSEINMGVDAFRDSLYAMLKRNTFLNIKFENMLDTLGEMSRTDL